MDKLKPKRRSITEWLVIGALALTGFNTVFTIQNQRELNSVQNNMRSDQATLEVRRFKAERRACEISQTTVKNERRIITRSMNAHRRAGTLTRERLNFYRVTLRDLKVPSCSPTTLGFPQFEPTRLMQVK